MIGVEEKYVCVTTLGCWVVNVKNFQILVRKLGKTGSDKLEPQISILLNDNLGIQDDNYLRKFSILYNSIVLIAHNLIIHRVIDVKQCSGNGACDECGQCICRNSSFFGEACQCSELTCPLSADGKVCSGNLKVCSMTQDMIYLVSNIKLQVFAY